MYQKLGELDIKITLLTSVFQKKFRDHSGLFKFIYLGVEKGQILILLKNRETPKLKLLNYEL